MSERKAPRSMSVRKRAIIALSLGLMNAIGFLWWGVLADSRLVWGAVVAIVVTGIYGLSLRCPKCGTPIAKRKVRVLGETFTYWGGFWVPRECSRCGAPLGDADEGWS